MFFKYIKIVIFIFSNVPPKPHKFVTTTLNSDLNIILMLTNLYNILWVFIFLNIQNIVKYLWKVWIALNLIYNIDIYLVMENYINNENILFMEGGSEGSELKIPPKLGPVSMPSDSGGSIVDGKKPVPSESGSSNVGDKRPAPTGDVSKDFKFKKPWLLPTDVPADAIKSDLSEETEKEIWPIIYTKDHGELISSRDMRDWGVKENHEFSDFKPFKKLLGKYVGGGAAQEKKINKYTEDCDQMANYLEYCAKVWKRTEVHTNIDDNPMLNEKGSEFFLDFCKHCKIKPEAGSDCIKNTVALRDAFRKHP